MSHQYEIDSANNASPAAGSPASPHAREYERAEEVLQQDSELFRMFTSARFTEACDKVGQMCDYGRDDEAGGDLLGLVLLGHSGSGKSATVEFMKRGQLQRVERLGPCSWRLATVDGEPLESVGDTASHTMIPHATEMELGDGRTVVVLDTGGLADTRGIEAQVVVETTASLALEKMPRKTVVGLVVPWRRLMAEERLGVVPELWRMLACVAGSATEVVAAEDEYADGGAGAAAAAPGGAVSGGRSESAPGDGDDDEVPDESDDAGDAELQAQVQRIVALKPRVVLLVTKVPEKDWMGVLDEATARRTIEARVDALEQCVDESGGGPGLMASRGLVLSLMRNNCVLVRPERGGGRDVLQRVLDDDSISGRPVRGSDLRVARTLETQVECDKHALALWQRLRREGEEVVMSLVQRGVKVQREMDKQRLLLPTLTDSVARVVDDVARLSRDSSGADRTNPYWFVSLEPLHPQTVVRCRQCDAVLLLNLDPGNVGLRLTVAGIRCTRGAHGISWTMALTAINFATAGASSTIVDESELSHMDRLRLLPPAERVAAAEGRLQEANAGLAQLEEAIARLRDELARALDNFRQRCDAFKNFLALLGDAVGQRRTLEANVDAEFSRLEADLARAMDRT